MELKSVTAVRFNLPLVFQGSLQCPCLSCSNIGLYHAARPCFPALISLIKFTSICLGRRWCPIVSNDKSSLQISKNNREKNLHIGRKFRTVQLKSQELPLSFASHGCRHHADLGGCCYHLCISAGHMWTHTFHLKQGRKKKSRHKMGLEMRFLQECMLMSPCYGKKLSLSLRFPTANPKRKT